MGENVNLTEFNRIWNDKPSTLTTVIGRIFMSLIIGSIYFGYVPFPLHFLLMGSRLILIMVPFRTPNASAGFQSKGAALFFSVL